MERESKVQSQMMSILRKHGCYVYKNAQNVYTEKGRPDLTACVPVNLGHLVKLWGEDADIGLFLTIEVKRPGKISNTSDAQEVVGRQIKKANGIWYVTDDPAFVEGAIRTIRGEDVIQ